LAERCRGRAGDVDGPLRVTLVKAVSPVEEEPLVVRGGGHPDLVSVRFDRYVDVRRSGPGKRVAHEDGSRRRRDDERGLAHDCDGGLVVLEGRREVACWGGLVGGVHTQECNPCYTGRLAGPGLPSGAEVGGGDPRGAG